MTADDVLDDDDFIFDDGDDLDFGDEEFIIADWDQDGDFLTAEDPDEEVEGAGSASLAATDLGGLDEDPWSVAEDLNDPNGLTGPVSVAGAASQAAGVQGSARSDDEVLATEEVGSEEDDVLFTHTPLQCEQVLAPAREEFDSESTEAWDGADVELTDLGVDMVDGPDTMHGHAEGDDEDGDAVFDITAEDELTLVDVEGELGADVDTPAVPYLSDAESREEEHEPELAEAGLDFESEAWDEAAATDEVSGPSDFQASEDDDPQWAPVDEHADDDDEDVPETEGEEETQYRYLDEDDEGVAADYSEYEEAYYDHQADGYAAADEAKRHPVLWGAGIAAALLISALAGTYHYKPEWFSRDSGQQVIDVIKVDRPVLRVDVAPPTLNPSTDPTTGDPTIGDPTTGDPTTGDPTTGDPTTADPTIGDPANGDPTTADPTMTGDPAAADPTPEDPSGGDPTGGDPMTGEPTANEDPASTDTDKVQIGEDGFVSGTGDQSVMDDHRKATVETVNGLVMGSQALAQMYNDNLFVGKVKALDSVEVTLRMEHGGEITLIRDELRTLTHLRDGEYREWKDIVATGTIKLRNSNRLKGKIVEARDDSVILLVNANRVIIPMTEIEEVAKASQRTIQMSNEENIDSDDWFRNLVEKKIQSDAKRTKKTDKDGDKDVKVSPERRG